MAGNPAACDRHVPDWVTTVEVPATSTAFTRPDLLVIDIDPPSSASIQDLRATARVVRDALDDAGLVPFVQTTGGRGFHVVAPLDGSADEEVVRPAVRALADHVAETAPEKLTTEQRKAGRGDRIFLDTNRNGYGQAGRARGDTIRDIRKRLAHKGDPWRDMHSHARPPGRLAEHLAN